MKIYIFLYIYIIIPVFAQSQGLIPNSLSAEAGFLLSSSNQTPFWLRSNQYGIVPNQSQFLTLRGAAYKDYDSTTHHLKIGYGINTVINTGKVNQILLPEAFIKIKYKPFEFYAGRRREIAGLVDSTLSSGSYIWSGNALPMPKLQISIPDYTSILGKGLISIKGTFAHGWFGKQNYLRDVMLHQKSFYTRLGKDTWRVKMFGGFNHQVQWGGRPYKINALRTVRNNKIPSSFRDYIYVVSGITLNTQEKQQNINIDEYTSYDLTNRIGNHIGTIDIGLNIDFQKSSLFLYRQSIYDDGSLFFLSNIQDGLTGLSFTNKKSTQSKLKLQKVNFEVFNSTNQGGLLGPNQTNNYLRGRDDYFNHGQFLDGWGYNSFTIGSPFITPYQTVRTALPTNIRTTVADIPVYFFTNNNRVNAKTLSIALKYNKTQIYYRISYSKNLGTYVNPFNQVGQFSTILSTAHSIQTKKILINGSISYDKGELFDNTFALMLSIKKTWL